MAKNNYVFLKSDKARKALGNVTGSKLPIIKIAYDYLSSFSHVDQPFRSRDKIFSIKHFVQVKFYLALFLRSDYNS
jgi:hypothetical protein